MKKVEKASKNKTGVCVSQRRRREERAACLRRTRKKKTRRRNGFCSQIIVLRGIALNYHFFYDTDAKN